MKLKDAVTEFFINGPGILRSFGLIVVLPVTVAFGIIDLIAIDRLYRWGPEDGRRH